MNSTYEQLIGPQLLDSRLKLHLMLQFLIHPRLATTATTLSERLRENPWAVAEALAELAEQQFLNCVVAHGNPIYQIGTDLHRRGRLDRLIEDFNDPYKRDQIHALVGAANRERQFYAWFAAGER